MTPAPFTLLVTTIANVGHRPVSVGRVVSDADPRHRTANIRRRLVTWHHQLPRASSRLARGEQRITLCRPGPGDPLACYTSSFPQPPATQAARAIAGRANRIVTHAVMVFVSQTAGSLAGGRGI